MQLTIIKDMGLVQVDGKGYDELDMTGIPDNVHAVQWYGSHGDIEYVDGTPNLDITELPAWALTAKSRRDAKDAEEVAKAEAEEAEFKALMESPEHKAKLIRSERDRLLAGSDWVVVMMTELGAPVPAEWVNYRSALRNITVQNTFPESVVWPTKP